MITALILAGGQGLRMGGVDKGWIAHRGRPLIAHVIERIAPQAHCIIISANRSLANYAALGHEVLPDDAEGPVHAGPLAGIATGLPKLPPLTGQWLLVVPVDAPALPLDLAVRLHDAARTRHTQRSSRHVRAAVAQVAGRMEPLFCLLSGEAAGSIRQALQNGERSVARWLASINAQPVCFDDPAAFMNVNTPSDLVTAAPCP